MRKEKGFTLIEFGVSIVFAITVFIVVVTTVIGINNNSITVGINGVTDSRCVSGFVVMQNENGTTTQLLNEFGKGVPCDKGAIR